MRHDGAALVAGGITGYGRSSVLSHFLPTGVFVLGAPSTSVLVNVQLLLSTHALVVE